MKKVALVLSGGGFKGAFQLGALKYLKENWGEFDPTNNNMKFDIVAGVSVGSLNGLMVASDKFDDLEKLWNDVAKNGVEEIYKSGVIDTKPDTGNPNPELKMSLSWDTVKSHFPKTMKNIIWRFLFNKEALLSAFKADFSGFKSIADNSPLKTKLISYAKKSDIKNCIYICGYVSLNDGKYYSAKHTDFITDSDFVNGILASTSMPIVWDPVEQINTINGQQKYSVDGGIRNVSPLGDVIREINKDSSNEEYTIIIINCSSGEIIEDNYKSKNIAQIALRSLDDIAITEIFNNDLEQFIDKNFILKQLKDKLPDEDIYDYDYFNKTAGKILKPFNTIIIQPSGDVLGDTLVANDILINRRIEHGRQKAEEALKQYLNDKSSMKFIIV
jgi:NTE family protein